MKSVELKGQVREKLGKTASASLRKEGLVPCVLYGNGEPIHFSAPSISFKNLIYTPDAHLVVLDIAGKKHDAILQDSQFNFVSDELTHADFKAISQEEQVTILIPVKTVGKCKGVLAGGNLSIIIRKLKVKALPKNLPDYIEVDMTNIDLGGSFKVKSLNLPEGVEVLNSPEAVVAGVKITRTARLAQQGQGK